MTTPEERAAARATRLSERREFDRLLAASSLGTPAVRKIIDEAPCGIEYHQRRIDEVRQYDLVRKRDKYRSEGRPGTL